MTNVTLADCLRRARDNAPMLMPGNWNLVVEESGVPTASTRLDTVFYIDTDTDTVFYNSEKTPEGWGVVVSGNILMDGDKVLTATI